MCGAVKPRYISDTGARDYECRHCLLLATIPAQLMGACLRHGRCAPAAAASAPQSAAPRSARAAPPPSCSARAPCPARPRPTLRRPSRPPPPSAAAAPALCASADSGAGQGGVWGLFTFSHTAAIQQLRLRSATAHSSAQRRACIQACTAVAVDCGAGVSSAVRPARHSPAASSGSASPHAPPSSVDSSARARPAAAPSASRCSALSCAPASTLCGQSRACLG